MEININIIQYIAIAGSFVLLAFVLYLVIKKKIKEEYSLLWIFLCLIFLLFSFWRDGLNVLSYTIGIGYPPVAFLLILIMAIFLILIQFSVVISALKEKNNNLIQELAILRNLLEKKIKNN